MEDTWQLFDLKAAPSIGGIYISVYLTFTFREHAKRGRAHKQDSLLVQIGRGLVREAGGGRVGGVGRSRVMQEKGQAKANVRGHSHEFHFCRKHKTRKKILT